LAFTHTTVLSLIDALAARQDFETALESPRVLYCIKGAGEDELAALADRVAAGERAASSFAVVWITNPPLVRETLASFRPCVAAIPVVTDPGVRTFTLTLRQNVGAEKLPRRVATTRSFTSEIDHVDIFADLAAAAAGCKEPKPDSR
jgi:hypothetical protein